MIPNSKEFFVFILEGLAIEPAQAIMAGDDFEGKVFGVNRAGITGAWLNQRSDKTRTGAMYGTINNFRLLRKL